jgi:VIT1/CCC1 family predicted Fe2+/Mn2+ transporter
MAHRYLSFTDRTGEIAFAVLMVIIINGYVALSNLNSGFLYIVAVNIGACASWGFIDGFIYAISISIERNNQTNKLVTLKRIAANSEKQDNATIQEKIEENLNDVAWFASLNQAGKDKIAQQVVMYAPKIPIKKNKLITREEALGWVSINLIYLTVGLLMALPFLVIEDKLTAWFISNVLGVIWLFWYGTQLGKSLGKHRLLLGFSMSIVGILFLLVSYIVWTQ